MSTDPAKADYTVDSTAFIPRALQAIERTAERTGISRTDVINRAVQLYELIEEKKAQGKTLVFLGTDGSRETVEFF